MTNSAFDELIKSNKLIRVGWGGTRRCCYKIGETGLCVKFYKPKELYDAEEVQSSVRRDIDKRRFDERLNSSCQEVEAYERYKRLLKPEVFAHFPERCEKVFHPDYGWGVLETYYTNPDGTAIIPYEYEISRQTPENRDIIFDQARKLIEELCKATIPFYEPGNFHSLIHPDGSIETKIVDFETTSKTFFRPEAFIPALRRIKLRRKAARYFARIRYRYGVCRENTASRVIGEKLVSFVRLGGNSSENFHAKTESGREFFVKFTSRSVSAKIISLYNAMASSGIVPSLVKTSPDYMPVRALVFEWGRGEKVKPWQYTPEHILSLVQAHKKVLEAISGVPASLAFPAWEGVANQDWQVVPIHGDMHAGNLLFDGDNVTACFDFERLRVGLPAEDLLRLFMHAYERTHFWRVGRLMALRRNLHTCVAVSGYAIGMWALARAAYISHKEGRRASKHKSTLFLSPLRILRRIGYRWFMSWPERAP